MVPSYKLCMYACIGQNMLYIGFSIVCDFTEGLVSPKDKGGLLYFWVRNNFPRNTDIECYLVLE